MYGGPVALDTSHLELLAALSENSTLASASKSINLSPSAASRRLQDAERLLGVSLTSKSGRTLRLTAAGRILAEAAAHTSKQLAEAELAARWLGNDGKQPIRIGVGFQDSISWLLPKSVDLRYEIARVGQDTAGQKQTIGELDLVIDVIGAETTNPGVGEHEKSAQSRSGNNKSEFGDSHVLAGDELVLVVGADHPLTKQQSVSAAAVATQTYLAGALDPQPGFEFGQFFLPSGDCPTDIVLIQSFSLLVDLVARNEGITIQPRRSIVGPRERGVVLIELDRSIPVAWVAKSTDDSNPRVRQFLELVAELADRG